MSSAAAPPRGAGRPKLFGRPETLLVDADGPRISMPPPPPARTESAAPPIAVVPPPEEPTGAGPARVFIGLPGKAPQPRIAVPTLDDESTDERGRDEVADSDGFGVAAYTASGPAVLPRGQVAGFTQALDRSLASAASVTVPTLVAGDAGQVRPGSPVLRLAPNLDVDEDEDELPPPAVARVAPGPRAFVPAAPAEPQSLWEGLPESEPAPRPVVPVRRPLRTSPELTPPPADPHPVYSPAGRARTTPTADRVEAYRPPPPRPKAVRLAARPVGSPAAQTRPAPLGPPPREPLPMLPPTPGTKFPPPGGRRALPTTDPVGRAREGGRGGWLPWALLGIGLAIAAGGTWFFGFGPGRTQHVVAPTPVVEVPEPGPAPVVAAPAPAPAKADRAAILGTGMLSIVADQKAVVYVDGVRRGTLPELGSFEITAGEHTVRAVAGRQVRTMNVRVDEGQANKIVFDFTK